MNLTHDDNALHRAIRRACFPAIAAFALTAAQVTLAQENRSPSSATGGNVLSVEADAGAGLRDSAEALIRSFNSAGEGVTPLMRAARSNNVKMLDRQLAKGADVNELSDYGWTALMFAAWKGNAESVERLLAAGADPNVVSERIARNTQGPTPGTTALAAAVNAGHLAVARTLLSRGAGPDPMAVAIAGGLDDLSLLREFQARGTDLSQPSGVLYYPSALSVASLKGKLENVRWLIENGVVPHADALNSAVGHDHLAVVGFLVTDAADGAAYGQAELSAALRHAATKGNTKPENYAANLSIIRLLLDRGAARDYRSTDPFANQQTALQYLKEQRGHAVERIEHNRYGEQQQAWEKGWLAHRDAIVELLDD
ncbi:MAG: ankyrin repeat domain-containing protein [Pseudomonadota bacterium]